MGSSVSIKVLRVYSLLVLFLWPCVSTQPQVICPALRPPPDLNGSGYLSPVQKPFGQGFLSPVIHSFLSTVQHNPLPKDLIVQLMNTTNIDQATIKKVLVYETGFLVCVAIGILYILLMPLIGLFFACCRCCGNCGGRMYQKQTRSTNCKRRSFYWSSFLITMLILAGNICMFLSNKYTGDTVNSSESTIKNIIQDLQGYTETVPKQLDQVVQESKVTVDTVSTRVKDTGPLIGKAIQNSLQGPYNSSLNSLEVVAQVVNSIKVSLTELQRTQSKLQTELDLVQTNLTKVKKSISNTLQDSRCVGCNNVQSDVNNLSQDTNLNLPSLTDLQSTVDKADLSASIQKAKKYFEDIPQTVTTGTQSTVKDVTKKLEDIKSQVSQVTTKLPVNTITNISNSLSDVQKSISKVFPEVTKAEKIRSAIAVTLCCVILLVVICNLLGLLLGPAGLRSSDYPTERSSTANCGGVFLMASVGLSFLFCWFLMIIVLILFIVGGNSYTLICVPWQSGELYQLIDTPGVGPKFNLAQTIGLQTKLTVSGLYQDCKMNKPLWSTLHLQEIINLNDILNISKYTGEIQKAFENSNIDIPTITLLSPDTEKQLTDVSAKANSLDFRSFLQKNFSQMNLIQTADKLTELSKTQPSPIKDNLVRDANELRNIQRHIDSVINPLVVELKSKVSKLSELVSQINKAVENLQKSVKSTQDFINTNKNQIVKNDTRAFVDCQLAVFKAFADWANQTITGQVGRCGPVAAVADRVEDLFCAQLIMSLNAFWFSMGWCLAFFIPSIIFSVKLAKYYRRMKHLDSYENNTMMNQIPRATVKH